MEDHIIQTFSEKYNNTVQLAYTHTYTHIKPGLTYLLIIYKGKVMKDMNYYIKIQFFHLL